MDVSTAMAWVAEYEQAWHAGDTGAVARLFTEDAVYLTTPYDPARVGHSSIEEFWTVDEGREFTVEASPVAVQDDTAVVRLVVTYLQDEPQEYTDLWVLQFADDGRVARYEEWPFWPGGPRSAEGDGDD